MHFWLCLSKETDEEQRLLWETVSHLIRGEWARSGAGRLSTTRSMHFAMKASLPSEDFVKKAFDQELRRYVEGNPSSRRAAVESARVMPGGDTRTTTWFHPFPVLIDEAAGFEMRTLDGQVLTDFLGNYTALVHGHRPRQVTGTIKKTLRRGWLFGAPLIEQSALAELLTERVPSVDLIRFTNSGTEAGLLALRLARVFTGRSRVALARHGYHGSSDELSSEAVRGDAVQFSFNDIQQTCQSIYRRRDEVAAVFIEPILGSGGLIPADQPFVAAVRELCNEIGALLIFDEVMSFRLAYGGYQEDFDDFPDLSMFGKLIGGGLPVGAVGGRSDVMSLCDPRDGPCVSHGGTFNGNRLTMASGVATLELLDRGAIQRINTLGDSLRARLVEVGQDAGSLVSVTGHGSLLNIHAAPGVKGPEGASRAASSLLASYLHIALLNRGIFIAPRGEMCVSTVMNEGVIEKAVEAVADALQTLGQ